MGANLKAEADVLLQILGVRVHGPKGFKNVTALLNSGAQTSLIFTDFLKELGITGGHSDLRLQNVEWAGPDPTSECVSLTVSPADDNDVRPLMMFDYALPLEHASVPEAWTVPEINVTTFE